MELALLYGVTAVMFLALDMAVLPRLVLPLFRAALGPTMRASFRYGPAVGFYVLFIGAVVWLITGPALQKETAAARVALDAAVLGFAAYGTYEFTNMATIKGWTWRMLITDLAWGMSLTVIAATGGLLLTRAALGLF
ncbi:MAG: DUF2177 family protein [Pseudomonadota bacterium]